MNSSLRRRTSSSRALTVFASPVSDVMSGVLRKEAHLFSAANDRQLLYAMMDR